MQSHSCCAHTANPELSDIRGSLTLAPRFSASLVYVLPAELYVIDGSSNAFRWSFETHGPPQIEPPPLAVLRI
jgi:hypothetical protein